MAKKNILFIAPSNLSIRDGTSIRVTNLAKAVANICNYVFLLSYTSNEELSTLTNLRHVKMDTPRFMHHLPLAYADIFLPKSSFYFIAKGILGTRFCEVLKDIAMHADIIHIHFLMNKYFIKILNKSVKYNSKPIIIDLHGLYRLQPIPMHSTRAALAHLLGLTHEILAIRDGVITAFTVPSEGLKSFLANFYRIPSNRIFVVPDAVDEQVIEYARKCHAIEEEVGRYLSKQYIDSSNSIAYVGTISAFHGFFDLVKAIKVIEKEFRKSVTLLLIVPNKKQVLEISDLLPKNTIIMENIPRKLIPCILRKVSVLVLPHRAGTQFDYIPSNKIYDYMLAGRPIVAYRTPATVETLRSYSMKILVKPNDAYALAEGIIRALELWRNIEPRPIFSNIPTLEEVKRSLDLAYKYFMYHAT